MLLKFIVAIVSAKESWENTAHTTSLWESIAGGEDKEQELDQLVFASNGDILNHRSEDGRGGLWWAWEFENVHALALNLYYQHDIERTDVEDKGSEPPVEMCKNEAGTARHDELIELAKKKVPSIEQRKEVFMKGMEALKKKQEEEVRAKKEKEDKEDEEEVEEDVDPSKDPFAEVKDVKKDSTEVKDEELEKEKEEAKKEAQRKIKEQAEAKKKKKSIMDDEDDDLSGSVVADDDL